MFKDMELSLDLAFDFRRHVEHEVEQGKCQPIMEFGVNILTLGQWPAYEPVEVAVFREILSTRYFLAYLTCWNV